MITRFGYLWKLVLEIANHRSLKHWVRQENRSQHLNSYRNVRWSFVLDNCGNVSLKLPVIYKFTVATESTTALKQL